MLDVALACAARGWPCFPCKADKTPWTRHGFHDATTDEAKVREWWGKRPDALVGLATGSQSGLHISDLDVKGPVNGLDEWHEIVKRLGPELEDTALVETPSGGMHVYHALPADGETFGSTAGKLAPGIDTRCEGGYVIAAGSPGYLWVDGHGPEALAPMPEALAERLRSCASADRPLSEPLPTIIPLGERNSTLTSIAGTMRRRGMSSAAILAALTVENTLCAVPLDEAEVRGIAESVSRYAPREALATGRVAIAESETAGTPEPQPAVSAVFIDWSTFWDRDDHEAEWVYPDVLARGRGHALYATHKAGKSLLMLYIAAELATGSAPIVVLYFDYEMTAADVFDRLEDMGHGLGTDLSRLRYALLPSLPPLDTAAGAVALTELVDGVQGEWPEHHLVVVFDTISRAVAGEENSADTFRAFYNHTGIQLKRRGITWARLDHSGKDATRGQRGSSGKGDDVDVVWKLTTTQSGVCLSRELARMSWVPEKVVLGLFEDPLRYRRLAEDWPAGTSDTAFVLDTIEVPLDASVRTARKALQAANAGRSTKLVAAALKWRRERVEDAGNAPGNASSDCPVTDPGNGG